MNRPPIPTSRLRADRDALEQAIAAEWAAITRLREQLMARRLVTPPAISLGTPAPSDVPALRASLAAHQGELTRLETRRDRVERELEIAKVTR